MPHLEFDAAVEEETGEPVTFTFAGEEFTCIDGLGAMPILELGAAADIDANTAAGLAALYRFLRAILAEGEFARFKEICTKKRIKTDSILGVVQGVMPHLVGRPTKEPSTSDDSSSTTGLPSKVVSLSPDGRVGGSLD
jgi:hypothetical protein